MYVFVRKYLFVVLLITIFIYSLCVGIVENGLLCIARGIYDSIESLRIELTYFVS